MATVPQEHPKDKVIAYSITTVIHVALLILMIISWPHEVTEDGLYGDGIPLRLGNVELAGGDDVPVPDPGGNNNATEAYTPDNTAGAPETPTKGQKDIATDDNGRVKLPDKDKEGADGEAAKRAKEAEDRAKKARDLEREFETGGGPGQGTPANNGNATGPGQQGGPEGGLGQKPGKGIGTLTGKIKARNPVRQPNVIQGNFNYAGTVAVNICIDKTGKVVTARQNLSNQKNKITDKKMVDAAIKYAKEYVFDAKDEALDKECGDVLIEFTFK